MNNLLVCDHHLTSQGRRSKCPKCPAYRTQQRLNRFGYTAHISRGEIWTDAPMYVLQHFATFPPTPARTLTIPPRPVSVPEILEQTYEFRFNIGGRVKVPANREAEALEEFKLELEGMISAFERYIADPVEAHHELVGVA
jgi:hypothetical protein